GVGDRLDGLRLSGPTTASPQSVHGLERLKHTGRNKLVCSTPLKDAADAVDVGVNDVATHPVLDHLLADRLEGPGAGLFDWGPTVARSQPPSYPLEILAFAGR